MMDLESRAKRKKTAAEAVESKQKTKNKQTKNLAMLVSYTRRATVSGLYRQYNFQVLTYAQ